MRTLFQVLEHQGPSGSVLPEILPNLTRRGIRLRRGQVTMAVAQPNGGKSLFSLWYAVTSGVRCLFVSADTDPHTTLLRALAMSTQMTTDEVEAMVLSDRVKLREAATAISSIRFTFDPSPTLEDIDLEVQAYEEVFGAYPELIVVDNLMNVTPTTDSEWQGMRETMSFMHVMARKTESCVLILHHVSENDSKAHFPAPRRAIQGKVAQLAEQILSLAMEPSAGVLRVACVKNRHGSHDANAEDFETCYVDPPRMTLYATAQDMQLAHTRREWS